MDIGHDMIAGLRARIGGRIADGTMPSPDWPGLHARFAAAHAARRELLVAMQGRGPRSASFDPAVVAVMAQSQAVNLDDSADGKDRAPTDSARVGTGKTGDRGYR